MRAALFNRLGIGWNTRRAALTADSWALWVAGFLLLLLSMAITPRFVSFWCGLRLAAPGGFQVLPLVCIYITGLFLSCSKALASGFPNSSVWWWQLWNYSASDHVGQLTNALLFFLFCWLFLWRTLTNTSYSAVLGGKFISVPLPVHKYKFVTDATSFKAHIFWYMCYHQCHLYFMVFSKGSVNLSLRLYNP